MKIYTRTGDKGQTSLLGGKRVSKSDQRIEAYGGVDELNAHIGLIRDQYDDEGISQLLLEVQNQLFTIGSHLALQPGKSLETVPKLRQENIDILENEMDRMNEALPEMRNFVLPGGNVRISTCHIARCVCRRAERYVVALSENESVDSIVVKYLNRLSDYLFVLSRKISRDLEIDEIPWRPKN